MSWSLNKTGTAKELAAFVDKAGGECGNVPEMDKHKPAIKRLIVGNATKDDENGPRLDLQASGYEHDGNSQVYIKLGPAAALILLALGLLFMPSVSAAADTKLPARVETNQVNPPAPVFNAPDAVPSAELTAANLPTLPGQPVIKTAKAGRGLLAWLFRGRGRRCCSG